MLSESYQWALVPESSSISDMADALTSVGFHPEGESEYKVEVLDWKPLRAQVKKDEIVFSFYWPGSSTTTKFYDYLLKCGTLIEKVRFRLSRQPKLLEEESNPKLPEGESEDE